MITLKSFKSISPPFVASCSGLFRQGTTGKQRFSQRFWMYHTGLKIPTFQASSARVVPSFNLQIEVALFAV
jgi:hypothetical protein